MAPLSQPAREEQEPDPNGRREVAAELVSQALRAFVLRVADRRDLAARTRPGQSEVVVVCTAGPGPSTSGSPGATPVWTTPFSQRAFRAIIPSDSGEHRHPFVPNRDFWDDIHRQLSKVAYVMAERLHTDSYSLGEKPSDVAGCPWCLVRCLLGCRDPLRSAQISRNGEARRLHYAKTCRWNRSTGVLSGRWPRTLREYPDNECLPGAVLTDHT